jgi:hypothetical protein
MRPSKSPFTNSADLKKLPHVLDGSFAWLRKTPRHREWTIGERSARELPGQLKSVIASARAHGIRLPDEFVGFVRKPALHAHLRSVTACYLDVANSVLSFRRGFLVRFLRDQQDCAFWYLYLNKTASDHCVVSSIEYFDADDMDDEIDDPKETDFRFESVSFEAFLSQFWLENEILFSRYDSTPPPDVDPRFLKSFAP